MNPSASGLAAGRRRGATTLGGLAGLRHLVFRADDVRAIPKRGHRGRRQCNSLFQHDFSSESPQVSESLGQPEAGPGLLPQKPGEC